MVKSSYFVGKKDKLTIEIVEVEQKMVRIIHNT